MLKLTASSIQFWDLQAEVSQSELEAVDVRINEFCAKMGYSKSRYSRKFGSNNSEDTQLKGKWGEWVASRILSQQFGLPEVSPDFTIYSAKEKSFAPDLIYPGMKVEVKTGLQEEVSWVFKKGGKHQDSDVMAFMHIDKDNRVRLLATAPWALVKMLLQPMGKESYRYSMDAVHLKDLQNPYPLFKAYYRWQLRIIKSKYGNALPWYEFA